ncbi:hypothetical protein [Larkinella soli]|uniref:hypothetical protein n=1 Tax=Larkinella soli TaxID=1770527 RepID=UPI000FFCC259|nr:hypothetical protein [Larkinella soli]
MNWFFLTGAAINGAAILYAVYEMLSDRRFRRKTDSIGSLLSATLLSTGDVGLAMFLKNNGQPELGVMVLWMLALPLLTYGLFVGMLLLVRPDWK